MNWLFIEPGRIGDWILSQHVVSRFAQENGIRISWAVRQPVLPLLPLGPEFHDAIPLPSPMTALQAAGLGIRLLTHRSRYDACVALSPARTGRFAIRWLKKSERLGYCGPDFLCNTRRGTTAVYDPEIYHLMGRALLPFYPEEAGQPYAFYQQHPEHHPRLTLPQDRKQKAQALLKTSACQNTDFILLCPGAKWPGRLWDNRQWLRLAEELSKTKKPVLFITDPQCAELNALLSTALLPQNVGILPPLSLTEFLAVMSCAKTVVALDSGPMHLAAALGIPCVALYGPSNEQLTGALATPDRIAYVHGKLDCQPCITPAFEPPRSACLRPGTNELRDCMASISLQEVVDQIQKISRPRI